MSCSISIKRSLILVPAVDVGGCLEGKQDRTPLFVLAKRSACSDIHPLQTRPVIFLWEDTVGRTLLCPLWTYKDHRSTSAGRLLYALYLSSIIVMHGGRHRRVPCTASPQCDRACRFDENVIALQHASPKSCTRLIRPSDCSAKFHKLVDAAA